MFSNVNKRLQSFFKPKIILTVFILLLITLAFANFFILISLKTTVHGQPESLLGSVFLIHYHKNASVFARGDDDKRIVDLHKSREVKTADAVKNGDSRERLREKLRLRKSETSHLKTHSTVKHIPSIKAGIIYKGKKAGIIYKEKKSTETKSKKIRHSTTDTETKNKKIRHSTTGLHDNCTAWCRRGDHLKPPYLLTAVLLVRIYRNDLAKLSSREMVQWLQYLRYAGFQHVYVYDAYVKPSESQRDVIKPFVQSGYATYIDWSIHNPYTIQGTQVAAYQDCINKFGRESKWQAAIDIDEYPFSPRDLDENFMARFLSDYSKNNPDVSEITMRNYLFLGKPIDDKIEPFLIARIRRRTHKPANPLVKPIYKPADIAWAQVHHNGVKSGSSRDSQEQMLRMNHYWGARLQDWGDDTPKVLDMTEPDYTIEPIVQRMKQCSSCLGKDGLYLQRWA